MLNTEGNFYIVILDKGFVYAGYLSASESEKMYTIKNCKNIRVWGTTKGLGELVNGPTDDTRFDDVGVLKFPDHALISMIPADSEKWTVGE